MTTQPDSPCDTRMMGIVHSALRRDLVRVRIVLTEPDLLTEERRVGVADHIGWLMHTLHLHHHGEDIGLYPMVLRNDPTTRELVEDMDGDHQRIDATMDELERAARAFAGDPGADPAARLLPALTALEDVLLPHLEREELVMMPVVSGCVTQREWDEWNDTVNVRSKPFLYLAEEGHWVLDNLGADDRHHTLQLLPPVPRFVLLNLLGGRYRRRRALLWDGTPAEHVPSMSLETAQGRTA
jgi:hypothetical protein